MTPLNSNSTRGPKPQKTERLVVLPFFKSVEIAVKSIRVRFSRSMITTLSLVLAVAFLGYLKVNMDVANGLLSTGDPNLKRDLIKAGYDIGPDDANVASTPKQRWIIILSMLVCVVGIINAQLMAVTERFREIGTMKCLGALDRFILRLFIMEAAIEGLIGAGAGALLGAFFALATAVARHGFVAVTAISWAETSQSILFSMGVGCLLSLVGVIYPALMAARMQPVEAMRVEH